MRKGTIMQTGTPQEILSAEVMRKVFNIDARIMEDPVTNTPVCYGYEILKEDI